MWLFNCITLIYIPAYILLDNASYYSIYHNTSNILYSFNACAVPLRFKHGTRYKANKRKKEKKEKCGLCALITENALLAIIYLSLYILLEFWRFGDKLHNYFTFAIIISFSPSIYWVQIETLRNKFTKFSQLAAYVIKLVCANTFCKLFVQPFRLVSFCAFV